MQILGLVRDPESRWGRTFDLIVQATIIVSVVSVGVETIPDLPAAAVAVLRGMELLAIALFTFEYVLRLVAAERKLQFAFSFYGIIDLVAILPFYLALGGDARVVRVFRLFRLIRLLKLTRYSAAADRLAAAFKSARDEIVVFLGMALLMLYLCGLGIYHFEHEAQPEKFRSVLDGMWWAVATLTTVGYGDIYPITGGGKIFTAAILIVGLGIVAIPTGIIASALARSRNTG